MRKWLTRGAIALVVLFGLVQLVPYGRNHDNPPVTKEIAWGSARTRELAVGAGRLTNAEREELAVGLERTLAADPPVGGGQ